MTRQRAGARLLRGISANLFSLVIRIGSQLTLIPILFAFWPADRVGVWMMLATVPSFIGLIAGGYAAAAANAALSASDNARKRQGRQAFAASMFAATIGTAALSLVVLIAIEAVPQRILGDGLTPTLPQFRTITALLVAYSFASAWQSALEVPLRLAGRYPEHIAIGSGSAGLDVAAVAVAVAMGGGFVELAAAMAGVRICAFIATYLFARRVSPAVMRWRKGGDTVRYAKGLLKPALAFIILTLIPVLNLQSYALIVGLAFGPVVLAGFVATRTLARLFDIVVGAVFTIQYFEHAHLDGDTQAKQRRLLATMTVVMLVAAIAFVMFLVLLGGPVQRIWTMGETRFDPAIAAIVVTGALLRGLAASPAAALAARNDHGAHTSAYLGGSIIALAAAIALAIAGAPPLAVIAMIVAAELGHTVAAFARAFAKLNYRARDFLTDLVSTQRLADVTAVLRHVTRREART